jgi:hypothetical protein
LRWGNLRLLRWDVEKLTAAELLLSDVLFIGD